MKIAKDPAEAGSIVDFVPFFKAFCNSTRAQIIEFLLGGERCVCEMTGPLDQSQPLVSHHLALLRDAGPHDRNEKERHVKLEILGSGCANCQKLMASTEEVVRELGVTGAELVKVED